MNTLESLNRAMDYIETHLDEELELRHIAEIAGCSPYHFQSMFLYLAGISLSEYIRRRKLTAAAVDLRTAKVIDVALKYGYNSPDAFSRAFQHLHGIKPSQARIDGAALKTYPRITFSILIQGVSAMNYRIEEKGAFKLAGVKEAVSSVNGENTEKIPKMWCNLPKETFGTIIGLSDCEPRGILGVCDSMRENDFDYWIAAATTKDCPEGLETLDVPACTWAIFESIGPMPHAIQDVWKRIYGEWFPSSGYEHACAPELEWYSDGDTNAPDYKSEVWIPVVKK